VSKILSQEEIDALLASTVTGSSTQESSGGGSTSSGVVVYNFRRPDRVSKDQLRSLHFLHDRFALNVSTSLSAFLRAMTEVSIVSVEQFAYSEFLMSLPDPTAFYAVGLHPLDGIGALELNPALAFSMVDRLLGGTGTTPAPNRALTEIEQNVVDSVIKLLLENLSETWKPIMDVQFRIQGRETRPQMLQVTGPNEIVILLVFDLRIGETRGMLNLCIPATSVEAVGEKFAQGWHRTRRQPTPDEEAWLHTNLGRLRIPVTALLETTLSAREVLALRRGDVIALGHSASNPIDVHVGDVPRFEARLGRSGNDVHVVVESISGEPVGQVLGQVEGKVA
jgi:flagellar motor switch protein FliM